VLSATTGTNISGTARMRQEGKCNFLSDFTRLLYSRANEEKVAARQRLLCI
jgi:hypothetical protein